MAQQLRDNPKNWTDAFSEAPSGFDIKAYQEKIDRICGIAKGHSVVRVVWGASEEELAAGPLTELGTATQIKIGRYRTRVKGQPRKVRMKRWCFEEWQPPAQIPQEGYVRMAGMSGLYVPPQLAQEQIHGKWLKWFPICDHSKCDPVECNSTEYFCFGDYIEPGERELEKLRSITAKRIADSNAGLNPSPFAPYPQELVAKHTAEAQDAAIAKRQEEDQEREAFYDEIEKTLAKTTVS